MFARSFRTSLVVLALAAACKKPTPVSDAGAASRPGPRISVTVRSPKASSWW